MLQLDIPLLLNNCWNFCTQIRPIIVFETLQVTFLASSFVSCEYLFVCCDYAFVYVTEYMCIT